MPPRTRTIRTAAVLSAATAVAALAGIAAAQADELPASQSSAPQQHQRAASDAMPFAVEDFNYPGAAQIEAERKIVLKKGDGHLTLTDCGSPDWNIKVDSRLDNAGYCFAANGAKGWLTLEVPDAYGIWTQDNSVDATLTAEGKQTEVSVDKDDFKPVGEGDVPSGAKPSVLVELRITG